MNAASTEHAWFAKAIGDTLGKSADGVEPGVERTWASIAARQAKMATAAEMAALLAVEE